MNAGNQQDWVAETVATLAPLATAQETAKVLRTSTRNLRRMIRDGRIRAVRREESGPSPVLVPRGEIERYLRGLVNP